MEAVFRTLGKVVSEFEEDERLRDSLVFSVWRQIAGQAIDQASEPLELEQKKLKIAVADENWQRHLTDLTPEMIFKLNSALKRSEVEFIQFVVDEKAVKRGAPENFVSEGQLAEIVPLLQSSAASIKDRDLRKTFLQAAASALARKEKMKNI
jgi:hypothetical protein